MKKRTNGYEISTQGEDTIFISQDDSEHCVAITVDEVDALIGHLQQAKAELTSPLSTEARIA